MGLGEARDVAARDERLLDYDPACEDPADRDAGLGTDPARPGGEAVRRPG